MKETITCNITGQNVEVTINRETGEFDLFSNRLKLNIQDNKANLVEIENGQEILICIGYFFKNHWFFSEHEKSQKDQDPFVAVIKLLYEILLIRVK